MRPCKSYKCCAKDSVEALSLSPMKGKKDYRFSRLKTYEYLEKTQSSKPID